MSLTIRLVRMRMASIRELAPDCAEALGKELLEK